MTRPTLLSARPPVEGVGQVGRGEVPDLAPGADGGDAEGDQDVALAGARRADQAKVLGAVTHSRGRGSPGSA